MDANCKFITRILRVASYALRLVVFPNVNTVQLKHFSQDQNQDLQWRIWGAGARCDAPLARPWKFFTGDFYEKVLFLPFFSKNCKIQQCLMVFCVSKFQKNGRICGFHSTFRSKRCFSFRGLRPLTPRLRALPLNLSLIHISEPTRQAESLVEGQGAKPPWSWNTFCFWTFNGCLLYTSDAADE